MNHPASGSDEELIESLSESDDAIDALADRYAQPLYDFSLRVTLDLEVAATITSDTFVYLKGHARERATGQSARAWLFAFALEQALAATNDRARGAEVKLSSSDRRFTQTGPEIDREVALWAWQAARSLRPRDYCVLDLTLRRELNAEELGGSAAQGRGGVYGALGRARGAFHEAYVATALYFRGRDACPDLAELVGGSAASMRVGIRRQIAAHVEDCVACQGTVAALPDASQVFASLANVDVPPELPGQMLAALTGVALPAATLAQLPLDADTPADVPEPLADGVAGPAAAAELTEAALWARPEGEDDTQTALSEAEIAGAVEAIEEEVEEEEEAAPVIAAAAPRIAPRAPARSYASTVYGTGGGEGRFGFLSGAGFLWSYVLLGVSTAIAIYLGIAVAESLRGGGGDAGDLPLGSSALRAIPCESGPFPVVHGSSSLIEFDPDALKGFVIKSVAVKPESVSATANALTAVAQGASALQVQARQVQSPTARTDQYLVQITWQREGEDALSDCTVLVPIAPSSTPAQSATPDTTATP